MENNHNLNEYNQTAPKKSMDQWILEAKQHLAELQELRAKIERERQNENK